MTADRLERCNPFAPVYADDFYYGKKEDRIFDPVERQKAFGREIGNFPGLEIYKIGFDTIRPIFTGEPYDISFADFLYKEKEYSSAMMEYHRAVFFSTDERIKDYARIMIAECHYQMGDFLKAREEVEKISDKGLRMLNRGRFLLALGRFDSTRSQFYYLKDSLLKKTADFLFGLSYLYEGDFAKAISHFKIKDLKPPSRRNPFISGLFSFFLPGAGQVYSGRAGDGLYSLLVVGTFGGISFYYRREKAKFWTFFSLTSIFHLGNIYGAARAARDYNLREKRRFREQMENKLVGEEIKIDVKEAIFR